MGSSIMSNFGDVSIRAATIEGGYCQKWQGLARELCVDGVTQFDDISNVNRCEDRFSRRLRSL